jgi:hypothetical protein
MDALLAHLRAAPDDAEAWKAARPLLAGDPRAPLVDLELAIRAGDRTLVAERHRLQKDIAATLQLTREHGVVGHFHWALFDVREVHGDLAGHLTRLAGLPLIDASRVELFAADSSAFVAPLAGFAPTRLRLREARLDAAAFADLAAADLPLTELAVWPAERIDLDAVLRVAPAAHTLALWACRLSRRGAAVLAGRPLTRLSIAFEEGPPLDVAPLAALPALRELGLFHSDVTGLLALRDLPLRSLALSGTPTGHDFWAALAAGALPELRRLDADESDFGDAEALALAGGGPRPLEGLELLYTPLDPATVEALLDAFPAARVAADLSSPARFDPARFFPGRAHDDGTPAWELSKRWWGDW